MKPFNTRLAYIITFVFFPLYFVWKKAKNNRIGLALLVTAIVFTGCFQHFFRTNTQTSVDDTTLKLLQNSNKYFVIHFVDNTVLGLNNVSVNSDKLEASMVELPDEHSKYINPLADKANSVSKRDKVAALLEVHLYTSNTPGNTNKPMLLPLSSFNRIDVYTFDEKRTRISHIISAVSLAAAITLVVVAGSVGPAF
ncbi:MAG: hypothetical protein ABI675_09925 [Chitinophagaceae bacterium]